MPRYKTERCQHISIWTDKKCNNEATFLVGIGGRTIDREKVCSRHVAATIIKMLGLNGQQVGGKTVIGNNANVTWHPRGFPKETDNGTR